MTHDADCRSDVPPQGDEQPTLVQLDTLRSPTRPRPLQGGYECGRCGTRFGTLRAFDDHRDDERKQR